MTSFGEVANKEVDVGEDDDNDPSHHLIAQLISICEIYGLFIIYTQSFLPKKLRSYIHPGPTMHH